jgi:hypothetical protein
LRLEFRRVEFFGFIFVGSLISESFV